MNITESNTTLDLKGGVLNDSIMIRGPIRNIKILNGRIKGEVRLRPLDIPDDSHTKPGHTERVRKLAPNNITLENIIFDTNGLTHQVYFGPGSTESKLIDCTFYGRSLGPSVYLSPEGGGHIVRKCGFYAETGGRREVLSIDGSSDNLIEDNNFKRCTWGGVYVYRNSGEDGKVRHQTPQNNTIKNNKFNLTGMQMIRFSNGSGHQGSLFYVPYGIILGSRQGDSSYSELDSQYNIGSGVSNLDYAQNNKVINNTFSGDWLKRHILNNDVGNTVVP
jgi:parallel beta-helix repeat protein